MTFSSYYERTMNGLWIHKTVNKCIFHMFYVSIKLIISTFNYNKGEDDDI